MLRQISNHLCQFPRGSLSLLYLFCLTQLSADRITYDENRISHFMQLHRHRIPLAISYITDKSASRNYRDTVTAKCRELLTAIVRPTLAVRYVVALGRRDLLWDLLPEYIEKNVLEVRDD